jgi:hypothetical protein
MTDLALKVDPVYEKTSNTDTMATTGSESRTLQTAANSTRRAGGAD